MQPASTVENIFARSWDLLSRNWAIIIPGVVVGIVVGVITGMFSLMQPEGDPIGVASSITHGFATLVSTVIIAVVGIAGYIITQCYTAGMAGAAWARGTTSLADGARAVNEDAGNVFMAGLGLLLLGIVAAILIIPTLGLSIAVFYLFTLYTIPAAVVGKQRGFDSLKESFAITRARFGTTLIIGVLLALLQIIGNLIAHLFAFAPLLGPIIAAVISQIVVAYAMLVIVGEYLIVRPAITPPSPAQPGAGTY
jgi:hypothetical protein